MSTVGAALSLLETMLMHSGATGAGTASNAAEWLYSTLAVVVASLPLLHAASSSAGSAGADVARASYPHRRDPALPPTVPTCALKQRPAHT